jgi:hypothetical protein
MEDPMPPDASHDMDLETVFRAFGTTAEMEAIAIRSVLAANGIPSVLMGAPQYPVLPFHVKVPRSALARARQVLAEARAAGPEAAEEAERALEEAGEPDKENF